MPTSLHSAALGPDSFCGFATPGTQACVICVAAAGVAHASTAVRNRKCGNAKLASFAMQDTRQFCQGTLCDPEVVSYLNEECLAWGGDVSNSNAWRVSLRQGSGGLQIVPAHLRCFAAIMGSRHVQPDTMSQPGRQALLEVWHMTEAYNSASSHSGSVLQLRCGCACLAPPVGFGTRAPRLP